MTNVEKLKALRMLGSVRKRLGANNEIDESFDDEINEMSSSELVEQWCGWHLGDGSWWIDMKRMFDELENNN